LKSFIPWVTWVWGINVAFLMCFHNVFHNLIFDKFMFLHFQLCACIVLQPFFWISTLINQFVNFKTPLLPKRTNISMPHGKIQLMFVRPSLNVGTCQKPPSINLQQETQYS
jgi:hypothetical protein